MLPTKEKFRIKWAYIIIIIIIKKNRSSLEVWARLSKKVEVWASTVSPSPYDQIQNKTKYCAKLKLGFEVGGLGPW